MLNQVINGCKQRLCMRFRNEKNADFSSCFRGRAVEEDVMHDDEFTKRKPIDKIWLMKEYPIQPWPLQTVLKWHREMLQPKMLNSMDSFIWARLRLDMTTAKKVRYSVM